MKGMEHMEIVDFFKNYESLVSFKPDKYDKSTLFQNEQLLIGLNCLEPGQHMEKPVHEVQTRFYIVLEGKGRIGIGDIENETAKGMVAWIPAGNSHWIKNTGSVPMVLLVGITPSKCM
jgi:quercetin dioxygenase-like cupin family protein